MKFLKESTVKQKLIALGIIALLSIGAMGAMGTFSNERKGGIISSLAETVGLKEKEVVSTEEIQPQTGTPQLSKEYIYAGSRTLATEDYGIAPGSQTKTNFALATNGGVPWASSELFNSGGNHPVTAITNGDRKGLNWASTGGWMDATQGVFPDWVQVNLNGTKSIDEINVFTIQDSWTSPIEPTEAMTFSLYGVTAFTVQYWNGTSWINVPNGVITGNNKVWNKFVFAPVVTSGVRVLTNSSGDGYSRLIEVEALGADSKGIVPPPPVPPVTPTIASVTPHAEPTWLSIVINPVAGALSYNVRHVASGYTVNVVETSFPWGGLQPGTYNEFQAQAVNNVGASGWSAAVGGTTGAPVPTPTPPPTVTYTLTASPASTTTYSTVFVNWTASQSRPTTDTIRLFNSSDPNTATPLSQQNITGGTSGQASVNMVTTGSFNFRYFVQGNPTPVAVSNTFTIVALSVTLTAPTATVPPPATVTTNWTANSSRPATDSIKLYRGTTLVASQPIVAGTSGANQFTGLPKGTYTFRYFVAGNATPIKTSNSFIVK